MSIFKESFPRFVDSQLRIREAILKHGNNSNRFGSPEAKLKDGTNIKIAHGAFYTNSVQKQCTIRMSSGVNMNGKYNKKEYKNGELAKLLVLEGGTTKEEGGQREGFIKKNQKGNAYGDPNIFSDSKDGFGIVPMPGITDASIRTVSQYGSLRIAKVNFQCHNQRQLNILERLYMRPGFPILLEWQWTPYINNKGKIVKSFPINNEFWKQYSDIEGIQDTLKENIGSSGGNYDGFLGVCKNFDFSVRPDGGYQCSTEIIAMGEVLDGLKTPNSGKGTMSKEGKKIELDDFELYLTAVKNWTSFEGEWKQEALSSDGDTSGASELLANFKRRSTSLMEHMRDIISVTTQDDNTLSLFESKDLNFKDAEKEIEDAAFTSNEYGGVLDWFISDIAIKKRTDKALAKAYNKLNLGTGSSKLEIISQILDSFVIEKGKEIMYVNYPKEDLEKDGKPLSPHTYIRWDFLANLINNFVFPHYQKNKPICELEWYKKGKLGKKVIGEYLNYSRYDITRNDVDVTIYRDSKSRAFGIDEGNTFDLEALLDGSFNPSVCLLPNQIEEPFDNAKALANGVDELKDVSNFAIGKIWLNLDHMLMVYREMKYTESGINKDFNFLDFIQRIWEKDVNEACAGTHNFMVNIDPLETNKIRIIDYSLNTKDIKPEDIYSFDIQSNKSIVRDFNFNSQIPSALGSTMATLAQNPDSINSIDSVTASALNRGLLSRFFKSTYEGDQAYYNRRLFWESELIDKANDLFDISTQMFKGMYNKEDNDEDKTNINKAALKATMNVIDRITELTNVLHVTYPLSEGPNGKEFKIGKEIKSGHPREKIKLPVSSIIPMKFQAKIDGIGGIVMGGVFKVKSDKLPLGYQGDDIAFIVHSLTHTITAGQDWTTEVSGQMTLLDLPFPTEHKEGVIISEGNIAIRAEGIRGKDKTNTPNGDLLRAVLKELDYFEKGNEITEAGDITYGLAEYAAAILDKIAKKLPEVQIKVSAGNDNFHQSRDASRHKSGNALDFVIDNYDSTSIRYTTEKFKDQYISKDLYNQQVILKILRQFCGGDNEEMSIFLDEYDYKSNGASGDHYHISLKEGTEGTSYIKDGHNQASAQNKTGIIKKDGTGGMGNLELSQLLVKEGKEGFYNGEKILPLDYKTRFGEYGGFSKSGFVTQKIDAKTIFIHSNGPGENNTLNIGRFERTYSISRGISVEITVGEDYLTQSEAMILDRENIQDNTPGFNEPLITNPINPGSYEPID